MSQDAMRYEENAFAWWLHDCVAHPITGCIGLVGRFLRSPRLTAISHHLHNATAPSNDAWGDWADAAYRAACNEDERPFLRGDCYLCGAKVEKYMHREGRMPSHNAKGCDFPCPLSGQRTSDTTGEEYKLLEEKLRIKRHDAKLRKTIKEVLLSEEVIAELASALRRKIEGEP